MLAAVALSLVLSASDAPAAEVSAAEKPALALQIGALGGAAVFDVDPSLAGGGARGPVAGATVSLRASRAPLVTGGGRLGVLLSLQGTFEPLAQRYTWGGLGAMTVSLLRLWIITGVGYGLTSTADGLAPHHVLQLHSAFALPVGHFWFTLALDVNMRLGTNGRTLQVLSGVSYEFELQRLFED